MGFPIAGHESPLDMGQKLCKMLNAQMRTCNNVYIYVYIYTWYHTILIYINIEFQFCVWQAPGEQAPFLVFVCI